MNIRVMITALTLAFASQAHAGFFDSLFGKKEEPAKTEAQAEVQTTPATQTSKTEGAKTEASTLDAAMGLLPTLTQGLGITNDQAEGGMGALLNVAKNNLSGDEFSALGNGIPNMDTLLAAAPALGSMSKAGGLGGLATQLGGTSTALGALGQVTQQFEALGLSPEMISQFASMAIDYFMKSDINTGELLQKGLGSLLG